jgi:hypothetical protein
MNFFDPKEDVIDLKLTQYGKHLLSKGRLIPKYYAFFDDDIIYDIKWVTGSLSERQSDIEDRIQDETPRPRVQSCFHGVETEIKKINELVRQKKAKLGDDMLQPQGSKHHVMSLPLGNSSLSTDKMPAWQAYFLKGRLDDSVDYVTGSSPNIKIPQLDCKVEFKARAIAETEEEEMPPTERQALDDEGADTDHVGMWGGEFEFDDGSRLLVEKDYLLLEIEESNTDYLEQNFDIEVYEIKVIPQLSGSTDPDDVTHQASGKYKGEKEELIPLYFARQAADLGSVYLTNAPEGSAQSVATMFPDVDPNYVEYFFDINVDREIDRATICENLPNDKARGARLQKEFRCPDEKTFTKGSLLDMADGLYDSEMQDLDEFEDCD